MTSSARGLLVALVGLLTFSWGTTAPADDPEVPEKYITVAEAKALVDQNKRVSFIDVRPRDHYEQAHIKGALSIPLGDLSRRLAEVPKQVPVVLY